MEKTEEQTITASVDDLKLYTLFEFSKKIRMSYQFVSKGVRDKQIKSIKIGNKYFVSESEYKKIMLNGLKLKA